MKPMYITKIDPKKPDNEEIAAAVEVLRGGGLVVFPTETAYGIGCDATNSRAVKRVFKAKNRSLAKTLPVVVASLAMSKNYAPLNALSGALAKAFWPGPLTIVVPAVPGMPKGTVSKDGEIAMRVSSHPVATALSGGLGKPIISTSANRSEKPECYDVPHVLADLGAAADTILDAGPLRKRKPSTLVRCDDEICQILREGSIDAERLARVLRACPRT